MAHEAPSWADQWGAGGIGAGEDDKKPDAQNNSGSSKKTADAKAAASAGFRKAKSSVLVGAQKVKGATSIGVKWVKNQCQKKSSK